MGYIHLNYGCEFPEKGFNFALMDHAGFDTSGELLKSPALGKLFSLAAVAQVMKSLARNPPFCLHFYGASGGHVPGCNGQLSPSHIAKEGITSPF